MKNGLTITSMDMADGVVTVLALSGFLDGHTFPEFEQRLQTCIQAGKTRLVIDLCGLTYIASAGVGAFISTHHQLKKVKGTVQLANASANVREIFAILGLEAIFTIHPTVDGAVAAAKA